MHNNHSLCFILRLIFGLISLIASNIIEERMLHGSFGSNSLLRQVVQHFRQQIYHIAFFIVRNWVEKLFEVYFFENTKGIEQTRLKWDSWLVFAYLLRCHWTHYPKNGEKLISLGFALKDRS